MVRVVRLTLSIITTGVAVLYQLPNLLSVADRWGLQVADPRTVGIEVRMEWPWYPIASSQSALGKMYELDAKHQMIIYHKPSLLWPWQARMLSIVKRATPIGKEEIVSQREYKWGPGRFLRTDLFPGTSRFLVSPSGMQAVILTDEISYLDEIEILRNSRNK